LLKKQKYAIIKVSKLIIYDPKGKLLGSKDKGVGMSKKWLKLK